MHGCEPGRPDMARILAFGAFLKNTACLLDTDQPKAPVWSAVHGDLSDPAACVALGDSVRALLDQVNACINAVAHDLHPDFFSSHLALRWADQLGVPSVAVQHHHAHIASVMAEYGMTQPVLGLALDGVGLGSDGAAWGGEVLQVSIQGFERVGHLLPLTLPGGDVAAREPWRMAAAALHACRETGLILPRLGPVVGQQAAQTIALMLQRGLNCPPTTAAGRWFDAAAGLLGLSVRQTEEAQAAIALEQAAARWLQCHTVQVNPRDWCVTEAGVIDIRPLFVSWLNRKDVFEQNAVDEAAARFHLTLADALAHLTVRVADQRGLRDVVLGGGCFFNRILKQRITDQLENSGMQVWCAQTLSCGDAGLALGQAWVAAQQLQASSTAASQQESDLCV